MHIRNFSLFDMKNLSKHFRFIMYMSFITEWENNVDKNLERQTPRIGLKYYPNIHLEQRNILILMRTLDVWYDNWIWNLQSAKH